MSFELSTSSDSRCSASNNTTWACIRKNNKKSCEENKEGAYFLKKHCEEHCRNDLENVLKIKQKVTEMMNHIDQMPNEVNEKIQIEIEIGGEKSHIEWKIFKSGAEIKIDSTNVKWTIDTNEKKANLYDFFLNVQNKNVSPDVYLNVVKLMVGVYAEIKKYEKCTIKLIDASYILSFPSNIVLLPWLLLCRGFSYYEARGFFSDKSTPLKVLQERSKIQNQTVIEFLGDIEIPEKMKNMKLYEVANSVLNSELPVYPEDEITLFRITSKILKKFDKRVFIFEKQINQDLFAELASNFEKLDWKKLTTE